MIRDIILTISHGIALLFAWLIVTKFITTGAFWLPIPETTAQWFATVFGAWAYFQAWFLRPEYRS